MNDKLLQVSTKTRNNIVELYATCEDDFVKGLELFEAIVEKQQWIHQKLKLKL